MRKPTRSYDDQSEHLLVLKSKRALCATGRHIIPQLTSATTSLLNREMCLLNTKARTPLSSLKMAGSRKGVSGS